MAEVRVVETDRERMDAFDVRRAVFVEEQGVDEDIEYDEHENSATHFVAYEDEKPVGAARLREPEDGLGKVERVAVLAMHRANGVGGALMDAVERSAQAVGMTKLTLHSQTRAAAFYEHLGYDRYGEVFEEAGIPHVKMEKSI